MYSIIQKEAKHSLITRVEGIKRCFLNQSTLPGDNGCFKLVTEGINVNVSLISIFAFPNFNLKFFLFNPSIYKYFKGDIKASGNVRRFKIVHKRYS